MHQKALYYCSFWPRAIELMRYLGCYVEFLASLYRTWVWTSLCRISTSTRGKYLLVSCWFKWLEKPGFCKLWHILGPTKEDLIKTLKNHLLKAKNYIHKKRVIAMNQTKIWKLYLGYI